MELIAWDESGKQTIGTHEDFGIDAKDVSNITTNFYYYPAKKKKYYNRLVEVNGKKVYLDYLFTPKMAKREAPEAEKTPYHIGEKTDRPIIAYGAETIVFGGVESIKDVEKEDVLKAIAEGTPIIYMRKEYYLDWWYTLSDYRLTVKKRMARRPGGALIDKPATHMLGSTTK